MTLLQSFKPVLAPSRSLADLLVGLPLPYHIAHGSDAIAVNHIAPLDLSGVGAFSFLSNKTFRELLKISQASVVALSQNDLDWLISENGIKPDTTYAVCAQPYAVYAWMAQQLYLQRQLNAGIHASAVIDEAAQVAKSAQVDARVVVGARAFIGERVHLRAGVVVGDDVVIADDTVIYPNVTVYERCEIGSRCIIHAGAVIGSDGFGFAPSPAGWHKIAQIGRVLVGNDVEIGANTTIDRGALSDTLIKNGVKLDNQIQIAHNCEIGEHTAIASCVGIAGSAKIGANCQIGGAAMIGGHLTIADGTIISGATAVPSSLTEAGQYSGIFPPMLHRDWERNASLIRHLSDLRKRLRALEKNVVK